MNDKTKRRLKMFLYAFVLFAALAALAAAALYRHISVRFGELPSESEKAEFLNIPYYYGGKFHNDEEVVMLASRRDLSRMLLRFFGKSENAPKPGDGPKIVRLDKSSFPEKRDAFSFIWLGHSTMVFEMDGARFMTDPVFGNASPVPFTVRRYMESPLRREDIPPLDFVIISHDHYDHLEYDTVKFLKGRDVKFVTALGVGARLRGWGVPAGRIIELAWEESVEIAGLTVTAERSRHFSGRRTNDRDSTLWASYVIEGKNDRRVYFGADSGYGRHFKEIGEKYGGFDLACLEIDAWNDNWPNNHMFPEESVRAHKDLQGKKFLPIHWGVFDLAMHPWDESVGRAREAAKKEGVEFVDVPMGEKRVLE